MAVDAQGDVYVADWRNDRIQKFTPDGQFVASFGESGQGEGQFHRPSSVAVDTEGYIYVADWGNERVQVLGPDGSFQLLLRGQATLSKWAEEYFAVNPEEWQTRVSLESHSALATAPQHALPHLVPDRAVFLGAGVGHTRSRESPLRPGNQSAPRADLPEDLSCSSGCRKENKGA